MKKEDCDEVDPMKKVGDSVAKHVGKNEVRVADSNISVVDREAAIDKAWAKRYNH